MAVSNGLSASEALVLISLPRFDARKAIKVGLFALLLQGVLRLQVEQRPGLLRQRQVVRLLVAREPMRALPSVPASLLGVVRSAGPGGLMSDVVKQAMRAYGRTLTKFVQEHVAPALIAQRLAEMRRERLLGLLPVTRFYPTRAGVAERARIDDAMRQASRIPEFLKNDPAQAAALAAACGSAILLVEGLRPHYQALSQAMRPPDGGDYTGSYDSGAGGSDGGFGAADRGFDFVACDFAAFDSFDAGFDAFDAGFDAACDAGGGDGGGDGGGC